MSMKKFNGIVMNRTSDLAVCNGVPQAYIQTYRYTCKYRHIFHKHKHKYINKMKEHASILIHTTEIFISSMPLTEYVLLSNTLSLPCLLTDQSDD
jgi:hypothetical protein